MLLALVLAAAPASAATFALNQHDALALMGACPLDPAIVDRVVRSEQRSDDGMGADQPACIELSANSGERGCVGAPELAADCAALRAAARTFLAKARARREATLALVGRLKAKGLDPLPSTFPCNWLLRRDRRDERVEIRLRACDLAASIATVSVQRRSVLPPSDAFPAGQPVYGTESVWMTSAEALECYTDGFERFTTPPPGACR